jgi:serine/threonine-protein kinase
VLRLKTFGGLGLQRDGLPPGPGATQRRRLALLVLLARAGERGMSRDKLLGLLWPDSEPDKARAILAQALYALRRDLDADDLFLGSTDLRLNSERITSDAAEFTAALEAGRLEDAVGLYAGPFLDGVYVNDAAEFERWAEGERSELAAQYAAALERLASQAMSRADHRAAVGWWRRLGVADPLSARVATGLMQALVASGDRAGAIQHARIYETLLRQELDAGPDPEVAAFAERLRAAGPAPVPPSPAPGPTATPAELRAPAPAPQAPPPMPAAVPASVDAPPAELGIRPGRWRVVAIAAIALAVVAAGLLARGRRADTADLSGRKMIAVLPFQNLGRPDDEYFADGLTEEVTSRLASIGGLGVISRTSSMQYKNAGKPLRQIARELGVSYVLEGSVRWEHQPDGSSRVRVTPQLIQVSDDSHLWADRYDAELADVFRVQGDIAEQVARALDVTLTRTVRQSLGARLTDSLGAYDRYLRASTLLDRAWGDDSSLRASVRSLQDAVRLDPGFALAHAKLSIGYAMMFRLVQRDDTLLALAKAHADTALRVGEDPPEGHTALGYYYYWGFKRLGQAREEFQRALELRPNDPDVLAGLGAVERREGRWTEALAHMRTGADLDPRSSDKAWNTGLAYLFVRDFPAAERYLDRAIALAPNWAFPYGTKAALYLNWYGDRERAAAVLREYPLDNVRQLASGLGTDRWLIMGDSARRPLFEHLTVAGFANDTLNFYNVKADWYEFVGDRQRARAYWDSMATAYLDGERREPEDDQYPTGVAIAMGHLGRKAETLRAIARARTILPFERDAAWGPDREVFFAEALVRVGETDSALAMLGHLLKIPSRLTAARLRVDPVWDPLRRDPRFQRLLAR